MTYSKSHETVICAGSFDPPSFGHINMIERALKLFNRVIIAIGTDNAKNSTLTVEERKDLLKEIFKSEPRIEIDTFNGLLVDYAKAKNIRVLLRGIRSIADYEYELQMSLANRMLDSSIETIFIMTEGRLSHISSSIIKQVIALGGDGREMIHPIVEKKLKEKLLGSRKGRT